MKVIKITAMWCSGCLIMNKVWKKILEKRNLEVISLDFDMEEEEVAQYHPGDVLPVVIFMKDHQEIERMVGEHTEEEILTVLDRIGD